MKLIIQIPCYNEEGTLPDTLSQLPTQIAGVDEIEVLVVNDGSTDGTTDVARELGVHHIISHTGNRGLAAAFQTGMNACLQRGADVIVNTDGDNQYPGTYIPDLVRPILDGKADIVIADRQTDRIAHFSRLKKGLQQLGSAVVRLVSSTSVPDAPSGFRAFSREAALRLNVLSRYSYTLDTIIQAGKKELVVQSVPIETNSKLRESRLMRSTRQYVFKSANTILHIVTLHEPLRTFGLLSTPFFLIGAILWARFLFLIITLGTATQGRFIQSVVVGASMLIIGFLVLLFGILAEMVAVNRRLHEEILYYVKKRFFEPDGEENLDAVDGNITAFVGQADEAD